MAAETGVCTVSSEVAGIVGKSELGTCSTHDVPKPGCSGMGNEDLASDLDNSYVFVTGADAKSDDPLEIKVAAAAAAAADVNNVLQPESSVDHFGVKVDVLNDEVYEPLMDGRNEPVEVSGGNPLVVKGISAENETSPVGGAWAPDTIAENSPVTKCWAELDAQNWNLDVNSGEVDKSLKKGENGNLERTYGRPFVVNDNASKQESFFRDGYGIQDQIEEHLKNIEYGPEAVIELVGDTKVKIESSEVVVAETGNYQNEKTESVADTQWKKVEDQSISEPSPGLEQNKESEAPSSGSVAAPGEEGYLNKLLSPVNEGCEEENEIKLTSEVTKTVEDEVSKQTSLHPGLECCPIDDKKQAIEMEAQPILNTGGDDWKWDTVPGNRGQHSLGNDKTEITIMECHVETACDQVSKENNREFSVSHVEDNVQYPEDPSEISYLNKVSLEILSSEIETKGPVLSHRISASSCVVHESLTDVKLSDTELVISASSSSVDGAKSITIENGSLSLNSQEVCTLNSRSSHCDPSIEMVVRIEKEQTFRGGNAHAGTEVSSLKFGDGLNPHTHTDVELKPECHDSSALDNTDLTSGVTVTSGIVVKNEGEQSCGVMGSKDETLLFQGNEDIGNFQNENLSKASSEGSSTNTVAMNGEDVSVGAVAKPFNFLIRTPRFNDEKLKEQIKDAKSEVIEKTKLRDAIQAKIQEKRANNQIHGIAYEHAKGESRGLRKLVALKRMEISSLQSIINKAKNAISIEEMDSRINNIEHMIQHETLPLREEKELIREIKQLKQLREQLSCNMGSQTEVQQALEQREEAEERLKILRKELAVLKDRASKAQTAIMEAESKYDDENKKIKELQAQFRAADDIRQAAYAKWQTLRKQLSQKNKNFVEYKNDEASANNCAFSGDREALYNLCMNQVEKFMELWNGNSEFRSEYIRFNSRSTLRRLGTLDGRSLGTDEQPPILSSHGNKERNDKMASIPANVDSISQSQSVELNQHTSLENVASDVQSIKIVKVSENQTMASKGPAKLKLPNTSALVSVGGVTDEMQEEDSVKTAEEVELTLKAEEIIREEAEAKKKEELRLEQLAKAKEAREKKKRHDEKMQMREELRARKEAELKEKEKEKKLRKKERKKAVSASTDVNDSSEAGESAMDIVKEDIQVSDNSSCAAAKRPKKTSIATKQNKSKSLPPPLRNRNRKKWQQWMWVIVTSLVVILVFWLGNMGLFTNVNLKRHGPAY